MIPIGIGDFLDALDIIDGLVDSLPERDSDPAFWILNSAAAHLCGFREDDDNRLWPTSTVAMWWGDDAGGRAA